MQVFLLTLGLILLSAGGLAIGLLFGRPPVKGSCGGLAALEGGGSCAVCGGSGEGCER